MAAAEKRWTHDVFLSFSGEEDSCKNFTDRLHSSLKDSAAAKTSLSPGVSEATIEDSRISLVVFSRNYVGSRSCLEELVKIMECRKMQRQMVLPIFYDVDPSDVRKQSSGCFAEAFAKNRQDHHLCEERMEKKFHRWKIALTEAGNLSGWDITKMAKSQEPKMVEKIAKEVLKELKNDYLDVAIHPVGLDARSEYVNWLLRIGSNDVRIIGICGISGMGKTTIAQAVYNQFFHSFQGKSFLSDIKETSRRPDGMIHLQKKLLQDVLKTQKLNVNSVDRGTNLIKQRLCNRRILLVLDDVDELEHLNALARSRDWFGLGSRIIVTTKDQHLLKILNVDEIYMAEELKSDESLELLSWHAFGRNHPNRDYAHLAKEVAGYCHGLPLAIEVMGSFLYDRSIEEWEYELEKLKKIPLDQIHDKLRLSYDSLDSFEQDIFCDIACFFVGWDKDDVVRILDGCGFFATIGISILTHRCLVKSDWTNKVMMHDLIREMGRKIVSDESPSAAGNRSRVWQCQEALDVLTNGTGTGVVEGLTLDLHKEKGISLRVETFQRMKNLRLLQLNYVHVAEKYERISKELRWLCWHGFPLNHLPEELYQENLVALNMRHSNLRQLWNGAQVLEKLKILDASHSHWLITTPDFHTLPNLVKLVLKDCTSLIEIHESIGQLDNLSLLDVKRCTRLKNLPTSICKLRSLEILKLSGCSKIDRLPEDIGDLEVLKKLVADETAIRQVPFSIVRLNNLTHLSLNGYEGSSSPAQSLRSLFCSWLLPKKRTNNNSIALLPSSLLGLNSLRNLCLDNRNLSDSQIPKDLWSLSSLQDLKLRGNDFLSLPPEISRLSKLYALSLDKCRKLQSLPMLPSGLWFLNASGCTELKRLEDASNLLPPWIFLSNCKKLEEIPGLKKLTFLDLEGCTNLSDSFKQNLLQEIAKSLPQSLMKQQHYSSYALSFRQQGMKLPGEEFPDWFSYQSKGSSLSFLVPQNMNCSIHCIGMCFCCNPKFQSGGSSVDGNPVIKLFNRSNNVNGIETTLLPRFDFNAVNKKKDHLYVFVAPEDVRRVNLSSGDEVEVFIGLLNDELVVTKVGIYLSYSKAEKEKDLGGDNESNEYFSCVSTGNDDIIDDDDDDDDGVLESKATFPQDDDLAEGDDNMATESIGSKQKMRKKKKKRGHEDDNVGPSWSRKRICN